MSSTTTTSEWNWARYVAVAVAAYGVAGGLLSLLGWFAGVPRLIDWWGTGITMKANASIATASLGVALLIAVLFPTARVVARAFAFIAMSLGALTLFEHLSDLNLGIDTLLFDEPAGAAGTVAPGRMGPPASASFLSLGIAVVLLTSDAKHKGLSIGLALGVLGIGILSLIGYLYGAAAMYTVPRLTGIAIQTATMIAALSISVMAAQPNREPMRTLMEGSAAGTLARTFVVAAFLIPLALGWLRVQGQRAGLYDYAFGTALRTVIEIAILGGVLWWAVQTVRMRNIEQRRADREREEGEKRFHMVLDAAAVPFTLLAPVKDGSGSIVDFTWAYLNAAAAKALGKSAEEVIGKRISVVLPGTWNEPGLFEKYVAVAVNQEVKNFELASTANGIEGWFQVVASPLDDTVAVWFADVTERKQHELELRSADRRKDEFLATLAHELRNPLAPIRQAAMLASKPTISEAQRQWSNEVIERQVQHMALLLEDLLDVSRITRGTLELRKQPTLLAAVIDSSIETTRPIIERKKLSLTVDVPNEIQMLYVDPLRLSQVVSNLLNNAAKYTNPGGCIGLHAGFSETDLSITISDNGIGIQKEELGRIFQMFTQVKSGQERSEGGLGIGLALTRGLVELHGGTIAAESGGPGLGSRFVVTIPNACIRADTGGVKETAAGGPVLSRRILLADDNSDAADSLSLLLRSDGHEVAIARDGEEALSLFHQFKPDVALLDIGMPRVSGYDVARRIRLEDSAVLLIAITGWGQSSDRQQSIAAGFDHHLTKPVDYRELTTLLNPDANRRRLSSSGGSF